MRKIVKLICLIMIVVLRIVLVSCNSVHMDESCVSQVNSGYHPTEDGFYYLNNEGYLKFFDYSNYQSVFLCNKSGCAHDDEKCYALVFTRCFTINSGYIYIADDESHTLIRRNADGTNETEIVKLCEKYNSSNDSIAIPTGGVSIGNKMYLTYQVDVFDPQKGKAEKRSVISIVNLENNTESIIFDEKDTQYSILKIIDNDLYYFTYTGNIAMPNEGKCTLNRMHLDDNNTEIVYEDTINNFFVRGHYDKTIYFSKDSTSAVSQVYSLALEDSSIVEVDSILKYHDERGKIIYNYKEDKYFKVTCDETAEYITQIGEIKYEDNQELSFIEAMEEGLLFLSQKVNEEDGVIHLENSKVLYISKDDFYQNENLFLIVE